MFRGNSGTAGDLNRLQSKQTIRCGEELPGAAWLEVRATDLGTQREFCAFPLTVEHRERRETASSWQLSRESLMRRAHCHGNGNRTQNCSRNPCGALPPGHASKASRVSWGVVLQFTQKGAKAPFAQTREQWGPLGRKPRPL